MEQATFAPSKLTSSPDNEGGRALCLLSLDGGGIRGLSTLVILRHLMELINPEDPPKPCDYFDMIGGTSTGGLIALMLGRLKMTVEDCIKEYKRLLPEIFKKIDSRLNWKGQIQGRFNHVALENGVRDLLKRKGFDEATLLKEDSKTMACSTFVCTTSVQTGQTVIMSNYYSEQRGTNLWNKIKIWEAARATTAASSFFDPIQIAGQDFIDGATPANNPIRILWTEAGRLWREPNDPSWTIESNVQCLVSVGTGIPDIKAFGKDPLQIAKSLAKIATDTENVAEIFQQEHTQLFQANRAFRFNTGRGLAKIGLEKAEQEQAIIAATEHYIQTESVFNSLKSCVQNLRETQWVSDLTKCVEVLIQRPNALMSDALSKKDNMTADLLLRFTGTSPYKRWLSCSAPTSNWLWYQTPSAENAKNIPVHVVNKLVLTDVSCKQDLLYFDCSREQSSRNDQTANIEAIEVIQSLLAQSLSHSRDLGSRLKVISAVISPTKLIGMLKLPRSFSLVDLFDGLRASLSTSEFGETVFVITNADKILSDHVPLLFPQLRGLLYEPRFRNTARLIISSSPSLIIEENLVDIPSITDDTEYKECLDSLYFHEYCKRRSEVKLAISGTNEWIWTNNSYLAWERCQSGILWIQGKPGSGKSVLAKSIQTRLSLSVASADEVHLHSQSIQAHMVDWFYHGRGLDTQRAHTSLLQSMLWQLLYDDKSLFTYFVEPYRRMRELEELRWSGQSLRCVLEAVAKAAVPMLGIVDAIDESSDTHSGHHYLDIDHNAVFEKFRWDRSGVIRWLLNLTKLTPYTRLKFIVLSRPNPELWDELAECHQIVIHEANRGDILRIVNDGIDALSRTTIDISRRRRYQAPLEPGRNANKTLIPASRSSKRIVPTTIRADILAQRSKELEKVRLYLIDHADGVILWVTTILNILSDFIKGGIYGWDALDQKVRSLPPKLDILYKRIIKDLKTKLNPYEIEISRQVFMWVTAAMSWRALTLGELWDSLALPLHGNADFIEEALKSEIDPLQRFQPIQAEDWLGIRERFYYLCGPLLDFVQPQTIKSGQETIVEYENVTNSDMAQLTHQTVKDFLMLSEGASDLQFRLLEAEALMKNGAKTYLKIVFPELPTLYSPLPPIAHTTWGENVRAIIEYLDKKLLLSFILETRLAILPPLVSKIFDNIVSPPLSSRSREELELKFKDEEMFYKSFHNNWFEAAVIGSIFRHACVYGHVTAVVNLLAIIDSISGWWDKYHSAVYGSMLLTIIDAELPEEFNSRYMRWLYDDTEFVRNRPTYDGLVSHARPYIELAARTGNNELAMKLYDDEADWYATNYYSLWASTREASPNEFLHPLARADHLAKVKRWKEEKETIGPRSTITPDCGTHPDDIRESIHLIRDYWKRTPKHENKSHLHIRE